MIIRVLPWGDPKIASGGQIDFDADDFDHYENVFPSGYDTAHRTGRVAIPFADVGSILCVLLAEIH